MDILTIEDIYEKIGGFGIFQVFVLLATTYPEGPEGSLIVLPVFTGANLENWTCLTDDDEQINLSSNEICSCNGTILGNNLNQTIVSEWNLICENAYVSDFITSIQMTGMLCGGLFGSQIIEIFGRKKSLYSCSFFLIIASIASSLSTTPYTYALWRFVIGFCSSTNFIIAAIYPIEYLTIKWRSFVGAASPWGLGLMSLAIMAYYIPDWRSLTWIAAMPMIPVFFSIPWLPESPRWLLQKGKISETKKALEQVAKWNKKDAGFIEESMLKQISDNMNKMDEVSKKESSNGYVKIFKHRQLRNKMFLFIIAYFNVCLIYFGITFNTKNLSGNPYLNLFLLGLVDTLGNPSAFFVNNSFERKKALIGTMSVSTFCLIGIILIKLQFIQTHDAVLLAFSLISRYNICISYCCLRCFTPESFPTYVRSSAMGLVTIAEALGGILAPQLVFLASFYPLMIYCAFVTFAILCIIITFFMEETKGKPINDLMI